VTDDQYQTLLAWFHRLDARLEAIERQTKRRTIDVRYVDANAETRAVVLCGEIEDL